MLPSVPDVIVIEELFTPPEGKVRETHLVGVVTEADASYPGNSPPFFPSLHAMGESTLITGWQAR